MPDLPNSLALTSIATDASIISSDHRNNYAAIQTAVNALIVALSSGTLGQVLTATDSDTVAWGTPATTYRKTTSKTVNTTVAETDLLNAEITLAANDLGSTRRLRLYAAGDWKQNSGGAADLPRFKLKLGATTLIDTGVPGASTAANSATRFGWKIEANISELGTTAAQWSDFKLDIALPGNGVGPIAAFTTGEGVYQVPSGNNPALAYAFGANSTTVTDTGSLALVLSVINASANANYEVVLKNALVVIE